jgi:aspartate/methionine/tyrosine aminotransferase
LRSKLTASTKLIGLASPQNPTGVAVPATTMREALALIEEICPEAYLLVDETYRDTAYGNDPIAGTALVLSPRVISVASLSKCHGAPGLRLGWLITRDLELRRQLIIGKFNTVVSCSAIDEALALKVLEQQGSIIADRRPPSTASTRRSRQRVRG